MFDHIKVYYIYTPSFCLVTVGSRSVVVQGGPDAARRSSFQLISFCCSLPVGLGHAQFTFLSDTMFTVVASFIESLFIDSLFNVSFIAHKVVVLLSRVSNCFT